MRSARSILNAASGDGVAVGATLTHDETVIANQLHFGAMINAAFGDDRWAITPPGRLTRKPADEQDQTTTQQR